MYDRMYRGWFEIWSSWQINVPVLCSYAAPLYAHGNIIHEHINLHLLINTHISKLVFAFSKDQYFHSYNIQNLSVFLECYKKICLTYNIASFAHGLSNLAKGFTLLIRVLPAKLHRLYFCWDSTSVDILLPPVCSDIAETYSISTRFNMCKFFLWRGDVILVMDLARRCFKLWLVSANKQRGNIDQNTNNFVDKCASYANGILF